MGKRGRQREEGSKEEGRKKGRRRGGGGVPVCVFVYWMGPMHMKMGLMWAIKN